MKILYNESDAVIRISKTELRRFEHLLTWGMFALEFSSIGCPKTEKGIALELLSVGKAMNDGQEGERNYEIDNIKCGS